MKLSCLHFLPGLRSWVLSGVGGAVLIMAAAAWAQAAPGAMPAPSDVAVPSAATTPNLTAPAVQVGPPAGAGNAGDASPGASTVSPSAVGEPSGTQPLTESPPAAAGTVGPSTSPAAPAAPAPPSDVPQPLTDEDIDRALHFAREPALDAPPPRPATVQYVKLVGFLPPGEAAENRANRQREQLRDVCIADARLTNAKVEPLPDGYDNRARPATLEIFATATRVMTVLTRPYYAYSRHCALVPASIHRVTVESADGRCEIDYAKHTARGVCDDYQPAGGGPLGAAHLPGYDPDLLRAMSAAQQRAALAGTAHLSVAENGSSFRSVQRTDATGTGDFRIAAGVRCEVYRVTRLNGVEPCIARPEGVPLAYGPRIANELPGLMLQARSVGSPDSMQAVSVQLKHPAPVDFYRLPDFVWASLRAQAQAAAASAADAARASAVPGLGSVVGPGAGPALGPASGP